VLNIDDSAYADGVQYRSIKYLAHTTQGYRSIYAQSNDHALYNVVEYLDRQVLDVRVHAHLVVHR
jgi:hypothetical protein